MACWMCVHGKAKNKTDYGSDDWGPFDDKEGFCTISPKWEAVTSNHYCYELKMKHPELPGYWRRQLRESHKTETRLRTEIRKLKERKDYLNKKLKENQSRDRDNA